MEKIFKLIAIAIFKVDNALYKTFGFVSSFREHRWALKAKRLQQELDCEHAWRDHFNALYGTNYTTKQALALRKS